MEVLCSRGHTLYHGILAIRFRLRRREFRCFSAVVIVSYENGAIKFIEGFYPVSEIVLRLNKAQENKVQWRAEHSAAIERFWDFYNRESSSPGPPEPDGDHPS